MVRSFRQQTARRLQSAGLLLLMMTLSGCQSPTVPAPSATKAVASQTPEVSGPKIVHIVVCWLKTPGDAQARQKLIDVSKSFRQIPGVIDVRCGHVLPSTRPVVDSSYDIAVVMTFDGAESLKAYQTHPLHRKATRQVLMPLTDRIQIYDFIEE